MKAKLVAGENYTYLGVGNDGYLPLLAGKRKMNKYGNDHFCHTVTLYPIEAAYNQFAKSIYDDSIRKKQKKGR